MAVTLAQAAMLNPNELSAAVFENLAMVSDILRTFPVRQGYGQGYEALRRGTPPTAGSRAIGANWTEDSGGDFDKKTFPFAVVGGETKTDKAFIRRQKGREVADIRQEKLIEKIDAVKFYVHNMLVNGDDAVVATDFNGFKALIADGIALETAHGANGSNINADDTAILDFQQLIDEIVMRTPGANMAIMNAKLKATMARHAKKLGFYNTLKDEFGNIIEFYGRTQLVDIGTKADGTEIIPMNETQGSSNNCTSMYVCAVDDVRGMTLASTQNVETDSIVEDLGLIGTGLVYQIDFDLTLAPQTKYCLQRIKGIKLAA